MPARLLVLILIVLWGPSAGWGQAVVLNELLPRNSGAHPGSAMDEDGDVPDWIELHNRGAAPIDLAGYGLSDDPDAASRWTFPAVTLPAGGYLVVFASGKDRTAGARLHTDFQLASSGETVVLTAPDGTLLDAVTYPQAPTDVSFGRRADGDAWALFAWPTPHRPNSTESHAGITRAPTASPAGGFFTASASVTLATSEPGAIHYTLDGAEPTAASPRYTHPITIDSTTVVRARVLRDGYLPGPITTHTYLLDALEGLPVISVTTDPPNLWDVDAGIYVLGRRYNPRPPHRGANFWQDWEVPVHLEVFEPDGRTGLRADAGGRVYGAYSRSYDQKSLAFYARSRYGTPAFTYALFGNRPFFSYQSFVLRNAGNDFRNAHLRDGFIQALVDDLDLETLAFRPAVVYLNGAYWGVQHLREKISEHYVAAHAGADPDAIDLLYYDAAFDGPQVVHGDLTAYDAWVATLAEDITADSVYAAVQWQVDVGNFIDYTITQIFAANTDWPGNNMKPWRPRTPEGRWRWILFDTDFGFGLHNSYPHHPTLDFATTATGDDWPNPAWATYQLRRLLENDAFQAAFVNRFADLLNSRFSTSRVIAVLDSIQAGIAAAMPRHLERWGGSVNEWNDKVETIRAFARERPAFLWEHLQDFFGLGPRTPVALRNATPAGGRLRVNRLAVIDSPWTGSYFSGTPVTITAQAHPGYRFVGWTGTVESAEPSLRIDPAGGVRLTAHFEPDPTAPPPVVVNEIFYHPPDGHASGDWVELVNTGPAPVDLSGWVFMDADAAHRYDLPAGTTLAPGAYLILAEAPDDFDAVYAAETPVVGGWTFGLSKGGEVLRLYDAVGRRVDSLAYADAHPWPAAADGHGASLELRDPRTDNADAAHWRASRVFGGTPGRPNTVLATAAEPPPGEHPREITLSGYPNPFSTRARLGYALPRADHVRLQVFDVLGRRVATLVDGQQPAGRHHLDWVPERLAAGLYLVRLTTGYGAATTALLHAR